MMRLLVLLTALAALLPRAQAGSFVWTNLAGGVWNGATNWSPNSVPGWNVHNADDVYITNAGDYTVELTDGAPRYLTNLVIGPAASGVQTLRLAGGPLELRGALSVGARGVFTNEHSVLMNGPITVAPDGVFCLSPAYAGNGLSGTNTLSGPMLWHSGTVYGSLTVAPGGVVTLASADNKSVQGRLVNQGTLRWVDGFYFQLIGTEPRIINETNGLFDILGDNYLMSSYATDPRVENRGVIRKSAGPNAATISVPVVTTPGARFEASSGTLVLSGGGDFRGVRLAPATPGGIDFSGGTVVMDYDTLNEGSGLLGISGYVNLEGSVALTNLAVTGYGVILGTNSFYAGSSVILASQGGLGDASSRVSFDGELIWQKGVIDGQIKFGAPARVRICTGSDHYWKASVTNYGDISWTDSGSVTFYGRLENESCGAIDIRNSSAWSDNGSGNASGLSRIVNRGLIQKHSDSGTTSFRVPLDNYGRVLVHSGTLNFSSGANGEAGGVWSGASQVSAGAELGFAGGFVTMTGGAAFEGPGAVRFLYGVEVNGPVTTTNGFVSNGILRGAHTLAGQVTLETSGELAGQTLVTGTLNWTGGYASGALTVASNGVLNLQGNGDRYLSGVLTNHGRIRWQDAGSWHVFRLENAPEGVLDFALTNNATLGAWGQNRSANYGLIRKTDPSFLGVSIALDNAGRLEIQRGVLSASALTLSASSELAFPLGGSVAGRDYGLLQAPGLDLRGSIALPLVNGFTPALLERFTNVTTASSASLTNHLASSNLLFYATNRYLHVALASSRDYYPDDVLVATAHSAPLAQPMHVSLLEDHSAVINVGPYCTNEDGGLLRLAGEHFACAHGSTGLPADEPLEIVNQHTHYTPFWNYFGPDQFAYVVSDPQGATASSTVFLTVQPVNDPPTPIVSDKSITAGRRCGFQIATHDPDSTNGIVLSLGASSPAGAALSPDGWFSWQPSVSLQNQTNVVTVIATDGQDTNSVSFRITLRAPAPARLTLRPEGSGQWRCQISGEEELDYILQTSTNLVDWQSVSTNSRAVTPFERAISTRPGCDREFYRVLLAP